jgi:hypothetical protein
MKFYLFEITSDKRAVHYYAEGYDELDARMTMLNRLSGLVLRIDDVKLVGEYDEIPAHVQK